MSENLLSVKELAPRIGYSEQYARKLVREGAIPSIRIGANGKYRIPESAIQRFIDASMTGCCHE